MMNNNKKVQRLTESINDVINYLHRHNKKIYATSFLNAANYTFLYESGNISCRQYKPSINRNLCQTLYFLNSSLTCPTNLKKTVRQVIENYRKMNGLSTDDFRTDSGQDVVINIDPNASLLDSIGADIAQQGIGLYIINNTEKGQEYQLDDIIDDLVEKYPEKGHYDVRLGFENKVWQKLNQLISLEYFQVMQRQPINGKISVVKRVR